jgi:hypothetical protein
VVGIVTDAQGGEVLESIRSKLSAAERLKVTTLKDVHIFNIGDAYVFFFGNLMWAGALQACAATSKDCA